MPRRIMLLTFLLLLSLAAPAAAVEVDADRDTLLQGYERTIRDMLASGILPIIDIEHHWGGKKDAAELIEKMDRNGVALTWLGQNEKNGSAHVFKSAGRYPGRIVPATIHGDGHRWHGGDATLVAELAADVRSGRYFAMGEFEARHYPSSTNSRDVHLPLTSSGFEAVFQLSQESGLPFLLHHEAEDRLLPDLERMLSAYPGATVVWCHVGRNRNPVTWTILPTTDGVRALISKYPNLRFDLNQAKPGGEYAHTGILDAVLYRLDGFGPTRIPRLEPEWRRLLEEHPDRFLIGTDINTGRWENYDRVIDTFRSVILSGIDRRAAEMIAWKNAWKLMSGREWSD